MSRLGPNQDLDPIGEQLLRTGACALLSIDIESLAHVERCYGASAHHQSVTKLVALVREILEAASTITSRAPSSIVGLSLTVRVTTFSPNP